MLQNFVVRIQWRPGYTTLQQSSVNGGATYYNHSVPAQANGTSSPRYKIGMLKILDMVYEHR